MAGTANSNRWWENYLVRYFMPSIAGIAIVGWLASVNLGTAKAVVTLKSLLLFGATGSEALILLILYGNLFCYIASYPILNFHATRVIDFEKVTGKSKLSWCDGYVLSLLLAAALAVVVFVPEVSKDISKMCIAFTLVTLFGLAQINRLLVALRAEKVTGLGLPASSLAYGYSYALAKQRGLQDESVAIKMATSIDMEEGESAKQIAVSWRREMIDTYRHLREHGNSAFIFCLEIVLAGLCYLVITNAPGDVESKVAYLGMLLFVWALPAVSAHFIGQTFERRFSKFDRRLKK